MNLAPLHLPAGRALAPLRRSPHGVRPGATRRTVVSRALLAGRRFDDRPGFERNVSASELAVRDLGGIPTFHR